MFGKDARKNCYAKTILTGVFFCLLVKPTNAQSQAIGQAGDWGIYVAGVGGSLSCYVASKPQTRMPDNAKRNPSYFFISNRPSESIRQEISINAGFPAKPGNAWLLTERATYELASRDNYLWIKNGADNAAAIQAMSSSRTITVRAISTGGVLLTDVFSGTGLSTALGRADQECRGIRPSISTGTARTTVTPSPKNQQSSGPSQKNQSNEACKKFPDLC